MKLDDRDIICEQDYTTLSNAELVEAIERYAAIMHTAPLVDFDLEWITGPARALLARVEAAEAERGAAWQRVAKLEVITRPDSGLADLAGWPEADMAESLGVSGLTGRPVLECAMWWRREAYDARETMRAEIDIAAAAEARVAELETQLAEQQWRPGSETPPPDWYQTVETIDGVFSHAYFDGAVWQGYPDNYPPLWYRPIPPLPPAPDAQEPTP